MLKFPILLVSVLAASSGLAFGQDALLDLLGRKGLLTDREIQELREAPVEKLPAERISLSSSITELRLYGDMRLRYQYNNRDFEDDPPRTRDDQRSPSGTQQSRWRYRLRLNADFALGPQWSGGVELSTVQASDSVNQSYQNGFDDYDIYLSEAWLAWRPMSAFTFTAGKMPLPFYTSEMVWDPVISPTGLLQNIALHSFFDAKPDPDFQAHLIAGQFIYDDNPENAGPDSDASTDPYLFETQLVAKWRFSKHSHFTLAPAWLIYRNGTVSGIDNFNSFQDNDVISGATRHLNLLLLPGEFAFRLGEVPIRLYWDFAYNFEGAARVNEFYAINPDGSRSRIQHSSRDDFAYLIGVQLGQNRKKGDCSFLANWREVGLASMDPNYSDSDFAAGELNLRGLKFSVAYNVTDFAVAVVTYQFGWNLRDDLTGGQVTTGNAIADANAAQTLQVDFVIKF